MNIFKLIGELVVIYILYKVIFDFIIPVYNTSKQMKQKMNEMHRQQGAAAAREKEVFTNNSMPAKPSAPAEDYIEYEEVK